MIDRERIATITLSEQLVGEIAERVAVTVQRQLSAATPAASPWLCGARAAATYLGWPVNRIYKSIQRLPHRRDGNLLMFRRDELDRLLDARYEGPAEFDPAHPSVPPAFRDSRGAHE